METIFLAMSGGFDSTFAAYLLKKEGYKVIGITFRLHHRALQRIDTPISCQSQNIFARAKQAADYLSIPHHVIDLSEVFHECVISRFIEEYRSGSTPNPCVFCNQLIKFGAFANQAFSMGADKIATGHYARIIEENGEYHLKKGRDRSKDQSYFLYPIKKSLLQRVLFPLGEYKKMDLKKIAEDLSWNISSIPESQDICFIPDNDYRAFLSPYIEVKKGPVYHTTGRRLGEHQGLHLYTIGQRKGLNIPFSEPLYVVRTIPSDNALIVGSKEDLLEKTVYISETNFFFQPSSEIKGKVRYRQKEEPCVYTINNDLVRVDFDMPISSATPGQSLVLYAGDTVIGGGIIQKKDL